MVDREARLLGEWVDKDLKFNFTVMTDNFIMEDPSWLDPSVVSSNTGQQVSG